MKLSKYFGSILAVLIISAQAWSDEPRFGLGLFVVTDDMSESKEFYQKLFETEAYVDNGAFVGFNLSGNLFSLFSKDAFDHPLTRGNGVVPYIKVDDIFNEFERVKSLGATMVHEEVLEEGPIQLFMFKDPSGNPIEFYSLTAQ